MKLELTDWDKDLPLEPDEEYQALVRTLNFTEGFGLLFARCSPAEGEQLIGKVKEEINNKNIEVLQLKQAVNNLYEIIDKLDNKEQIDILFITGLEHSFYEYEESKRLTGWNTRDIYSYSWKSVPPVLINLNQQRERFRDSFNICFVFFLPLFAIKYFIQRAPDFFDWRSGLFDFPIDAETLKQESSRILQDGDYEKYLTLTPKERTQKILKIQELLAENHQVISSQAELLFELGNLHSSEQDYTKAIASYDQALKLKPDLHQAWDRRGVGLGSLERYEEEIASYDKAIEIKPDYHLAWYHRGIALKDLGKWKEALASWKKAIEIKPNDNSTLNWLGNALDKLGQSEEAIICYDQAIALNPNHPHAWYNRAIALRNLGRNEEAIASYDHALKIKSDDYEAWNGKGNALFALGRNEEAIASYEQALKFLPDYHQVWHNHGNLLYSQGRCEEALASYNKAQKIDSSCQSGWNEMGNLLLNLQRYEEAIASYDQALKIKPDDYKALYYKGVALIKLSRWREGNNSISKAIEINPDFMNALFDIQKKHIINWFQQKLGLQKVVRIWISFLRLIGFRR
ncbi:MAG: tetratricopeptide repeat protein [Nostoc sp. DedQUE04]|uniref:tetratricopeptide repeat protein n=1 Tax=Nostoc sp. DedQUE04 TaxID=3075390 RepID=UPI002AD33012|nr:tetratricopeptide repeat protein [Nostoc sp. DedQUE04]MDZ8137053.1 tetratricopeptide repeat protein [Nostoc sp. DedQUE04]